MAIIRANFNNYESGEEWIARLDLESQRNFKILVSLLSDYWKSSIDGPSYAREIKAMAMSIARLRLSLEDIQVDQNYSLTRTEFLYQVLTSALFPGSDGAPDLEKTDVEFRDFLNQVILLYFAGSVPPSVQKAVELLTGGQVIVRENFLEGRKKGSGYDISDEFGITIDVILPNPGSVNTILADKNIRILLAIIRPGHTLYKLKFILQDVYLGQKTASNPNKISDSFRAVLSNYSYEDFRKFVEGVSGVDKKGFKKAVAVYDEDHSSSW